MSLNDTRASNLSSRSYHTTFTLNQSTGVGGAQSEPETSEVEEGPSFRDALKAFQSKSTTTSANQSPLIPRTGLRLSQQHQSAAEQLLQSSTQRIEKTIQHTSTTTNRSYQMQDR